jgi:phytoene dehydrogenase-like protein
VSRSYDVVIIGGGHNGLVTAAYLAKAGRTVLVLEKRDLLGGCAVTEEIWPGYRVSTGAYLNSLLQQRVIEDLELAKYGYAVDPKDPSFFSPYPDGRHLFFWQSREKTLAEISKFSKRDAQAFVRFEDHLEKLAVVAESLLLEIPPEFPPRKISEYIDYLKLLGKVKGLGREELTGLVKIFTQSASDFLDEWFESPEIKVTLATDGVIGANGGPRSPGTAYILLHHCMGGVGGHRGLWGFVRGGMGQVSEAMALSAKASGAEIRLNADVAKILIKNGRATGVVLANGDEIGAKIVASNCDPKRTFLQLMDERDVPSDLLQGIRQFRSEGTSCKINLALNGLPQFKSFPWDGVGPHHGATMHICPDMDYVERAWDDAKYGRPSKSPLLEMTIPTIYDPTLAPKGKHIMGIFLQYAPYTLREGNWDDLREPFGDRVIEIIEEYCPNIKSIIEHRQVLTPLDLERRFGITGGNIFHGEMSVDQMFMMRPLAGSARYKMPVEGLYLCGSGAHPGGGVMGAPGYNAARAILKA